MAIGYDWKTGLMGSLSGAASGAQAGASGGPIGMGIGAAAGGLMGLLSGLTDDERDAVLARFPPEVQQQIMAQYKAASEGNPLGFENIDSQARQNFNTQTVPGLAERFTAMGSGNQRSSAFQGALGAHGAQLESSLAGLKGQYAQNQMNSLLPFLEQNYKKRQPGAMEGLAASTLQNGPAALEKLLAAYGSNQATSTGSSAGSSPAFMGEMMGRNTGSMDFGNPGSFGSFGKNQFALGGGAV